MYFRFENDSVSKILRSLSYVSLALEITARQTPKVKFLRKAMRNFEQCAVFRRTADGHGHLDELNYGFFKTNKTWS